MRGIYIPGMEMPTSCDNCNFCDYEQGNCLATKQEWNTLPHIGLRPNWCPLIPVPPHGRLIDGDAIAAYIEKQISEKNEIMKLCKRAEDIENYFSLSKIQTGMVSCRRVLENAPTIIPAESEGE